MTTLDESEAGEAGVPAGRANDNGSLAWAHAGRLRAAERELTSLLAQIGGLGRDGRNPSGQGPNYAPLSEASWDALSRMLDEIASSARKVGKMAGPVGAVSAVHGPAATRSAILQRLGQIEEIVRELEPARLSAKHGTLPTSVATELKEHCVWISDLIAQARELINTTD